MHPHLEHVLAMVAKIAPTVGRGYIKRTAEFIQKHYPGSAAEALPRLRAMYREFPP